MTIALLLTKLKTGKAAETTQNVGATTVAPMNVTTHPVAPVNGIVIPVVPGNAITDPLVLVTRNLTEGRKSIDHSFRER